MAEPTRNQMLDAFRSPQDGESAELPELQELMRQLEAEEDGVLAEALERSLGWDAQVREAIDDVPVPAGLAERLEAALAADRGAEEGEDSATEPLPAPGVRRRRWIAAAAAAGLAAAASLAALLLLGPGGRPETVDGFAITRMAAQWADQLRQNEGGWSDTRPPADKPWDPSVRRSSLVQWRRFAQLGDEQAAAYRSASLLLLVMRAPQVAGLGDAPPLEPQYDTGRHRIGAWRSGELVYVLVVTGDLQRYQRSLVRPDFALWSAPARPPAL